VHHAARAALPVEDDPPLEQGLEVREVPELLGEAAASVHEPCVAATVAEDRRDPSTPPAEFGLPPGWSDALPDDGQVRLPLTMITTNGDRAILDGPEPTDEGFLEIDARGHRVFYRVFGGGEETLLGLHGGPGGSQISLTRLGELGRRLPSRPLRPARRRTIRPARGSVALDARAVRRRGRSRA